MSVTITPLPGPDTHSVVLVPAPAGAQSAFSSIWPVVGLQTLRVRHTFPQRVPTGGLTGFYIPTASPVLDSFILLTCPWGWLVYCVWVKGSCTLYESVPALWSDQDTLCPPVLLPKLPSFRHVSQAHCGQKAIPNSSYPLCSLGF